MLLITSGSITLVSSLKPVPLSPPHRYIQGGPKNLEFIYNNVGILTCLNFSHLQSTVHLMQYTYQDVFFLLLKTVFELVNFDAF